MGLEVSRALQSVLKDSQTPEKLQMDTCKEYFNMTLRAIVTKQCIIYCTTVSVLKVSVVERFNETLKTRVWRYFTASNTRRNT